MRSALRGLTLSLALAGCAPTPPAGELELTYYYLEY